MNTYDIYYKDKFIETVTNTPIFPKVDEFINDIQIMFLIKPNHESRTNHIYKVVNTSTGSELIFTSNSLLVEYKSKTQHKIYNKDGDLYQVDSVIVGINKFTPVTPPIKPTLPIKPTPAAPAPCSGIKRKRHNRKPPSQETRDKIAAKIKLSWDKRKGIK